MANYDFAVKKSAGGKWLVNIEDWSLWTLQRRAARRAVETQRQPPPTGQSVHYLLSQTSEVALASPHAAAAILLGWRA